MKLWLGIIQALSLVLNFHFYRLSYVKETWEIWARVIVY